jgi:polynucleotide 5'-kinase involved in rRNA processing
VPETQPSFGLIREIDQLQELARDWTSLFPQAASQAEHWLKVLGQVQAHVSEDTCRLAVVGAVKSGKSTISTPWWARTCCAGAPASSPP